MWPAGHAITFAKSLVMAGDVFLQMHVSYKIWNTSSSQGLDSRLYPRAGHLNGVHSRASMTDSVLQKKF